VAVSLAPEVEDALGRYMSDLHKPVPSAVAVEMILIEWLVGRGFLRTLSTPRYVREHHGESGTAG
jgi:hypothetical protein